MTNWNELSSRCHKPRIRLLGNCTSYGICHSSWPINARSLSRASSITWCDVPVIPVLPITIIRFQGTTCTPTHALASKLNIKHPKNSTQTWSIPKTSPTPQAGDGSTCQLPTPPVPTMQPTAVFGPFLMAGAADMSPVSRLFLPFSKPTSGPRSRSRKDRRVTQLWSSNWEKGKGKMQGILQASSACSQQRLDAGRPGNPTRGCWKAHVLKHSGRKSQWDCWEVPGTKSCNFVVTTFLEWNGICLVDRYV